MKKSLFALWILVLLAFISFDSLAQSPFTSVASGPWNADATWSGTGIPVAGSSATIANGHTVTVTAAASCTSLTFAGAGANTTVVINTGVGLTVSGAVTIPQANAGLSNTLAVGAGTLTAGSVAFTAGGAASTRHRITISTGTATVTGNITQVGSTGSALIAFSGAGLLQLGGTIFTPAQGTLTTFAGSTVEYNGGGQTVQPFPLPSYSNLTLSGTGAKTTTGVTVNGILSMEGTAAVTTSAAITYGAAATLQYNSAVNRTVSNFEWPASFTGTGGVIIRNTGAITLNVLKQLGNNNNSPLNINTGATLNTANFGLTFHGDFINDGTFTAGSSPILITGTTATQSIDGFTTTGLVSMTKTGGTATFTGNANGGGLTINGAGGTLNLGSSLTHTFTGTWTRTAGTLNGGSSTLRIGGALSGTGGTFTAGTGTVEYNGAVQTVTPVIYNNLTLSGTGAKTTTGVTVNGILSMEGTAAVTTSAAITYGANATLQYNSAVSRTVSNFEWPASFTGTGGVIIRNTGAITLNVLKQLGNNNNSPLNINTGATLNTGNFGLTFHGNFINDGTLTAGSSPILITGTTATQSIDGFTTTGLVSMTKASGTATFTGNANGGGLTINGAGGTLNLGSSLTHTFTGTWTRTAGTLDGGSSTLRIGGAFSGTGGTFNASTGTVEYNGAAQTVAAVIYNNLTLSGSAAKTLTGVNTIGGNFTMNGTATAAPPASLAIGNTFTLGAGTTFTAGALTHFIAGNWVNNGGTFINTGSTISFEGNAQNIGGSSSTTFNKVVLNASGTKTLGIATFVSNNLYVVPGVIINPGSITTHTAATLTLGSTNQAAGTWGSTSSAATNKTDTYFTAGTTGILTVSTIAPSQTYYSIASGNWNSLNTWSTIGFGSTINTGSFPVAGDVVNIGGGNYTVTVNAASGCASITFEANAGDSPTVSLNSGISLDVSGPIAIPAAGALNINTLAVGDGTLTAGSVAFTGNGGLLLTRYQMTISTGTATISGDVTKSGTGIGGTITFTGAGLLQLGGTFLNSNNGNFTASTGTVEYNGTAQTVGDFTYNNLILSGSGTKTMIALTDMNGSVTIGAGTTLVAGAFTHTVGGNWVNNGSFTGTGCTITLDGAAQNIGGTSSTTFNNLALYGSGTKTFGAASFSTGYFAVGSGVVVNLGGFTTHTANSLSLGGVGQIAGVWGGTGSGAANINATYFGATLGRLTTAVAGPGIYYSRQGGNWNAPATWSTVTYGNATNTGTFPVAGDIVNIGGGNFTVTVNVASACASLTYQSGTGNSPTVSLNAGIALNVSGAVTIAGSGLLDTNTLAVGAGTLNTSSIAFTNGGFALLQTHALTISTGTVTVTGNVTENGSTGSATITFTGNGTMNLGGTFLNSSNATFTPGTGTVNYNGAAQTIGDFTYNNLTVGGSGIKTMMATTDMNGNVTIGAGTTLVAGTFSHTVGGNWINNGSFVHSGGTITFDGAAQNVGGANSTTFNNLALNGTGTKTFGAASFSAGNFSVGNGVVVNLGGFTNHTANSLTLGNVGQIAGVWGGTGSGAANINATYFGATPGRLTTVVNGPSTYYSRQTGNWSANTTWSTVTYANPTNNGTFPAAGDIVNIGGGNFTVTVNVASACMTLNYQSGTGSSPFVSINAGFTLNVSGAINIPQGSNFSGAVNTLAVGAGTLNAASIAFGTGLLASSPALTISSGTATVSGDVTHSGLGNAAVTFTGAGLLRLGGAFLNSGNCTFTRSTGTVMYNGTVAQTIADFTYYNLTLNNTFGTVGQLTMAANTIVINTLTMTSGIVNLNGRTLTLGSSGVASTLTRTASTTTNWLYGGTFSRFWLNATAVSSTVAPLYGLFPMGAATASSYRPVSINSTVSPTATGTFSVTHTAVTGVTDLSPVFNDGGTNIVRKHNAKFVTATTATGGTYSIGVTMTGLPATGSFADIRLAISNAPVTVFTVGTHAIATGTVVSNPTANRTGVALANLTGDFRITTTNSVNTPLPITLTSFQGEVIENAVYLNWTTATELNNDFFIVERSATGEGFSSIGEVKGSGTTTKSNSYTLIDYDPIYGSSYYRLKQTDFDGDISYSKIVAIKYEGSALLSMDVYPNPTNGDQFNIKISGLNNVESVPVIIYDQLGREYIHLSLDVDSSGIVHKSFTLGNALPQGMYILKAGVSRPLSKKFVVISK